MPRSIRAVAADAAMPMQDPESFDEATRFINALVAQDDIHKLDEAIAALSVEDLRNVVRRLIVDAGPVNRW